MNLSEQVTEKGVEYMGATPQVKDIMTTEVFTLVETDTFDMVDNLMKWRRIRHVPVVSEDGALVGLVTHRDFLKVAISRLTDIEQKELVKAYRSIQVADIMQPTVLAVNPTLPLAEAAQIMHENKFGCLLIVEDEKLVGIITEADFVRTFYEWNVSFQQ